MNNNPSFSQLREQLSLNKYDDVLGSTASIKKLSHPYFGEPARQHTTSIHGGEAQFQQSYLSPSFAPHNSSRAPTEVSSNQQRVQQLPLQQPLYKSSSQSSAFRRESGKQQYGGGQQMKEKLETLKSALTNIKTNINEIRSRTSMSPNNTDLSQNGTSTGQQQAQQSQLEHKHQQLFHHSGFTDDSQLVNTSGIIGAPPNAKSFDGGYRSSTSAIHQSMLENSNILMNTSGVIPRKPRNSSRASYKHLPEPEMMPTH